MEWLEISLKRKIIAILEDFLDVSDKSFFADGSIVIGNNDNFGNINSGRTGNFITRVTLFTK